MWVSQSDHKERKSVLRRQWWRLRHSLIQSFTRAGGAQGVTVRRLDTGQTFFLAAAQHRPQGQVRHTVLFMVSPIRMKLFLGCWLRQLRATRDFTKQSMSWLRRGWIFCHYQLNRSFLLSFFLSLWTVIKVAGSFRLISDQFGKAKLLSLFIGTGQNGPEFMEVADIGILSLSLHTRGVVTETDRRSVSQRPCCFLMVKLLGSDTSLHFLVLARLKSLLGF